MYKLMIIEDDIKLSSLVKEYFEKYDYKVYEVREFKDIKKEFDEINPDLLLLDINLPYYDGFYLCRVIRKKSNIPIIIVSARNGEMDQVMGIELGADDYISKPFKLEILMSKVKAALRRSYGEYSIKISNELRINKFNLDESSFRMNYKENSVELSKNEYKLVKKFIENKDKIVTREELLEVLWDDTSFVDDNSLTVNITRIKNKFMELGIEDVVKTKRGVGYFFNSSSIEEGDCDE